MTYTFFKKLMRVTPAFLILPFMVGGVIAKVTDEPDQNCYYHVSDIEGPSDNIMQELTDSCVYQSDRSTNNFNKTAQCVEDRGGLPLLDRLAAKLSYSHVMLRC